MLRNLKLASAVTLAILSGFVFAILAVIAYFAGEIDIVSLLGYTIGFNIFMWLAGPFINDLIMGIFYKMRFYSFQEIAAQYPDIAAFLEKICRENKIKVPKIGIIDDDNPTAFTYGSVQSNARMIFTRGLFTYLTVEEREAVLAHEIGHVVHYDFVVITIANTLIQILYEIYAVLSGSKAKDSGDKSGSPLAYIGLVSYAFYFLGTYILSFLSRTREYYADEFSAQATGNPNALSWALIKIAYGIVSRKDETKSSRLMESTRALGVLDVNSARGLGIVQQFSDDPALISKVMAFDFVSPWAFVTELGSTHPLTGKRIERLNEISEYWGKERTFSIREEVNSIVIDKPKLYGNFATGFTMFLLPYIAAFVGLLVYAIMGEEGLGWGAILIGSSMIVVAFYKFPSATPVRTSIRELMTDIYSSPIRGAKVIIEGKIIGRGYAGAILSEDLKLEDNGGLTYLDYNSSVGFLGDLFFALAKVRSIVGQPVVAEGWFFRGVSQYVSLDTVETIDYATHTKKTINSYPKLWSILGGAALFLIGVVLIAA